MLSKRVYDLPTRLFHLVFSVGFIIAFIVAKTFDDESTSYAVHMIIGMLMALAVLLRIIWGVFGSEYAKFSNFELSPFKLIDYIKKLIKSKTDLYVGHNPASSYAAIAFMLLSILLVVTGFLMVKKIDKEVFEELHELFAHLFFLISILHIGGVVMHTVKHNDPIGLSMFHGKKTTSLKVEEIKNNTFVAILFALVMLSASIYLFSNYNWQTGEFNLIGNKLQLVEIENE